MAKAFHELSEREILALAVSLEEDDGRTYGEFAERLRADYPATAAAVPGCASWWSMPCIKSRSWPAV